MALTSQARGMTRAQVKSKLAELTVRDIFSHTTEITTGAVIEKVYALFWSVGLTFNKHDRGEVLDWIRLIGPQCTCPGGKQ